MDTYTLDLDFNKYVFFVDKRNTKDFYAMSTSQHEKYYEIINDYGRDNEKVPDNFSIVAVKLGETAKNTFGLINSYEIEFPINQIRWEFVRTVTVL